MGGILNRGRIQSIRNMVENNSDNSENAIRDKLYNIWRSFMFTNKGKSVGCSDSWKLFINFYNDTKHKYIYGYRLIRLDKSKPFTNNNCIFANDLESGNYRTNNTCIEYNGESKTIREWSIYLNKSIAGIRNRYYKNNGLSSQEILLGKNRISKRDLLSIEGLSYQKIRDKASKMCSSYRIKDVRNNRNFDLTADYLIDNILKEKCIYCGSDKNVGCDRIDNKLGHTKDNVVPCCVICNTARNDNFTHEEMKKIGTTIREVINLRNC